VTDEKNIFGFAFKCAKVEDVYWEIAAMIQARQQAKTCVALLLPQVV
jgi:hypothetical protein